MTIASFNLTDLDGSNGFVINGINPDDYSGISVSDAGDINGDGINDIIIGAAEAGVAGKSYVVFGSTSSFEPGLNLSALDGSNGFVINGIAPGDVSGFSVSSAGDVNSDGIDDIIIGAFNASANAGESYVVFGSQSGFNSSLDLSTLDGSNGFVINGIDPNDSLGFSVSGAGDVNGDGIDDVIVGAGGGDPNGSNNAGESYVVFGSESEFAPSLELAALDGSKGFVINGIDSNDSLGRSVSSAGDVNGDGIDDIIIGAVGGDPNDNNNAGESYVVFGSESEFAPGLDLSALDGSNGFVINGINEYDSLGYSVSSAGDVNGDGINDIIIGAQDASPNNIYGAGASYVVFGRESGFEPSLDLAALDGSNGFVINGINEVDRLGRSVSSAGDVNADGIDDVVIGAFLARSQGISSNGKSYVLFGSSKGFESSLDLSTLNGSNGFVINGTDSSDFLGISVSGAGDVNNDGTDDLIIGAYGGDPNGNENAGESYVVFGFETEPVRATFGNDLLVGTLDNDTINGLAGNDTIDGGSGDDQIDGQQGNDNLTGGSGQDRFVITAGEGTDIITDFGGVGKGINPPQKVIDRVDTIQFSGEGLTVENLILTQNKQALELTFEGVKDTKLILSDFDLENLDNLPSGLGNILFDGHQQIQDSFDVFNAKQLRNRIFKRNTVTFLNNRDNTIQGFENSDDVINGQGGKDILLGLSGNDVLRGNDGDDVLLDGDVGNDILDGGAGSDGLFGSIGADRFVLREEEGTDTVFDFQDGKDSLVLADDLEYEQLKVSTSNGNTVIEVADTGEQLVSLVGVNANDIAFDDFSTLA
ncbi:FG-GAP repeat protein [Myxosarcina sp. GI1]|uniref:beta strand repeat-containing protein n=1 Tax=Myxosarcina sp. GI1 TaxID=1541065 RepID=UPI00068A3E64|nr:FG-GAP repeat protein [Myxosarcina sp. GI1]